MREILFRGRRTDGGEWVYGAYLAHDYGGHTIFNQNLGDGSLQGFEVIPETVGQYTGLVDKNSVKIFEGDVLSGEYYFRGEGWFDTGEGEFTINDPVIFKDGKFICRGFDLCEINDDVKVIGNIHDNHAKRDTEV